MKKIITSLMLMLSCAFAPKAFSATAITDNLITTSPEYSEPGSTSECKYSVDEALAGTKSLKVSGFVPRKTSADGKKVMGLVLFHNPTNKNPDSVDALALVLVAKDNPDTNQLILLVAYHDEKNKTVTTYKRQFTNVDGKQSLSECFEKVIGKEGTTE